MKSLVLCVCVLIIGLSSSTELKEHIRIAAGNYENDAETCRTENDLTWKDIYTEEEINTYVYAEPENAERTRKIGCWMACVLKKQNLMEGSNLKEAEIQVKLEELFKGDHITHKAARKCMKEVRSMTQECEKCVNLYACIATESREARRHKEHEKEEVETTGGVTEGEMKILEAEAEQE